ncbi:uncharacterized protein LOC132270614 [Cornus florida]|uniref:uncharacterized protein LOC132270614 n=1 Tax=Cornus florida TaxID=4283 RepID=UPI002898035A|nr:uncharacterized protein LOC132270614 [Cornus florida]XP_059627770.1 uncharacterized protein LOC132270614 [Cornus florida]
MPRPMVLAFLLIILIITSQFEWKQPLVSDIDASPSLSHKQQQISKSKEEVKEKIILSQEQNIQRLSELVRSLQKQLLLCRTNNETTNDTVSSLKENVIELERQQTPED